jgi:hypothetical protein
MFFPTIQHLPFPLKFVCQLIVERLEEKYRIVNGFDLLEHRYFGFIDFLAALKFVSIIELAASRLDGY